MAVAGARLASIRTTEFPYTVEANAFINPCHLHCPPDSRASLGSPPPGGSTQVTASSGYSSLQLPFELKVLEVCLDMVRGVVWRGGAWVGHVARRGGTFAGRRARCVRTAAGLGCLHLRRGSAAVRGRVYHALTCAAPTRGDRVAGVCSLRLVSRVAAEGPREWTLTLAVRCVLCVWLPSLQTAAHLDAATKALESDAYPTLDALTHKVRRLQGGAAGRPPACACPVASPRRVLAAPEAEPPTHAHRVPSYNLNAATYRSQVTAFNLEKARRIKNRLVRLTTNVESVREVRPARVET